MFSKLNYTGPYCSMEIYNKHPNSFPPFSMKTIYFMPLGDRRLTDQQRCNNVVFPKIQFGPPGAVPFQVYNSR